MHSYCPDNHGSKAGLLAFSDNFSFKLKQLQGSDPALC
jgi:hypothetical protein